MCKNRAYCIHFSRTAGMGAAYDRNYQLIGTGSEHWARVRVGQILEVHVGLVGAADIPVELVDAERDGHKFWTIWTDFYG